MQLHFLEKSGYQYFTAEFTSPRSYQAIKSILSGEIEYLHVIKYKDFVYNNTFPFVHINGHAVGCLNSVGLLKPQLKEWAENQKIVI